MMRKILISAWILIGALSLVGSASLAQQNDDVQTRTDVETHGNVSVQIEVFERLTCIHCQAEKEFLTKLAEQRDDFMVTYHDVDEPEANALWQQIAELENLSKVTPITLVGATIIQGFDTADTTGRQIEALIDKYVDKKNYTFEEIIAIGGLGDTAEGGATCDDGTACAIDESEESPWFVNVPFYGAIDVQPYSLPALSLILGFIDGFNPCAMWVLVTFLIVLAQIGSRKKMLQVAGLFIVAEAVMYYLILNVWFSAWDFVGLDNIITPIVGLVAIGGGVFFLYEWRTSKGTCKIISGEKRAKTTKRIRDLVNKPMNIAGVFGIIGLALSVNVIEFACSIGIPQAFTKIVELNSTSFWSSQYYMALYILMYMVDDLIVFGIALYSFNKIGLTTKYSRWSNLIGGILMISLGFILIFAREALVLG